MSAIADRLSAALSDRYRLERELGHGGMATVYLAEDLKHKRRVALKVLKPELAAVLGAERFVQEITTTAALQHPHILPLFDSGTADGFLYYVMPYIQGETLRTKLDREHQFGVDEAVRITREVADALDYAHRNGVIHRDIKPENILLHDGRPMVADFGIALALSAAAGGRMTETGLSLGTPHYMSPEQATAEKEISGRSDVYSLASVLYEMLTGEPPHTGKSAQQIIMKIIAEPVKPVTELRKSVPPHVAAAVAQALEKLPADRFGSAAAFANALGDHTFALSSGGGAGPGPAAGRRWLVPALSMGCLVLALALAWALTRTPAAAPRVYDVGLPEGAAMWTMRGEGFAVAPRGDFVVYQAVVNGHGELWYRSLLDAATRRIPGTQNGWQPTISPDGTQIAFLREPGQGWGLEIMSVNGGSSTTLGQGAGTADLQWLPDGRLLVIEGDGNRARWFDPGGGPPTTLPVPYCTTPASIADREALICSSGGASVTRIHDYVGPRTTALWTHAGDSTHLYGSHFKLINGRYLAYLTIGGDLAAAPVDLSTGRVGRSVRMATGLGRREFTGAGTFAIAASGTLVYALGTNRAVGHLVRATEGTLDTLPVGRAAFLRFGFSPDGRRLAAVVEGLEGDELRIHDLRTGEHQVWVRGGEIRQPVWSPASDRVLFSRGDSIYVGSPDRAGPPEPIYTTAEEFEAFSWMRDGRVVGVLWSTFIAVALQVDQRPVTIDSLLTSVGFVQPSPDGRWIAYNPPDLTTLWIEPLPRDGRRFQVAAGSVEDARWLSPSELVYSVLGNQKSIHRVQIVPSGDPPLGVRRRWLDLPEFRETEGQSFQLSQDGRVVYVRGTAEVPVQYLRVVPHWVAQMKRAVDEANR